MSIFHVVLACLACGVVGAVIGAFFAWNNPKQSLIDKAAAKLNSEKKS